jgi:ABC-type Fe3+/spermidine/putrescine transport system ATPase subunit
LSAAPDITDVILELQGVRKNFGQTVAADDLSLRVRRGEFFTFLGPSGSGKSTILRMIAGLDSPDSGKLFIDGRDVSAVPPWRRNLGMMFQQYAIFPHMSVADNVAYGLKVRGLGTADRRSCVERMLELVGLAGMGTKNVTLLSGGEQQRVALARALAPEPRMLLLDEPLSALDERIRRSMQVELKRVHAETGTTFLYVTHDQEEALTMSDRIAVFNRGRCIQCDAPEALYQRPSTTFVATFFRGCNVLEVDAPGSGAFSLAGVGFPGVEPGARVTPIRHIAIRAENIHIGPDAAALRFRLSGRIKDVTYRGTVLDYTILLGNDRTITATSTHRLDVAPGATVDIGIDPDHIVPLDD